MWVFMNDSFISIVSHRDKPGVLLVRARKPRDIEAVFPDAQSWEDARADYAFRAEVPAEQAALTLAARVNSIGYDNFKNSVKEKRRHDTYMKVWEVMWRWGLKR